MLICMVLLDFANKVVASEGMVEMQAEVLELLQSVNKKLDYRSFLAATMEKVSMLHSDVP